ncbi:MAG TPA: glycosyltransferase family 2 protein [Spirochaetota bacterium]|nr:glycosyltransferase family 2 protein [Spirochaetota bacterium]
MLSIIIVNYKSSGDITDCLESIFRFETKYTDYEILIVDNDSGDSGLDILKSKFPFIKIIHAEKNGGFAYGNNIGIKNASGDYILLLNPDTYLTDNSIEKLYNRIINDDKIGIIGPMLLFPDGTNQSYYLPKSYLNLWKLFCERFYLYRVFKRIPFFNSYYRTYMDYSRESYVEQVSGAALLFRKSILSKTGTLDEKYFMYFEESDFCLQAVKNGIAQLYYPESRIVHKGGLDSESGWERSSAWFTDSFRYYFKKNFSKTTFHTAVILFAIGACLKSTFFYMKRDNRYRFHIIQLKKIHRFR